jgi:hypothetical protein
MQADDPPLGREAEEGRRSLILSRGRYGYSAKCRGLPGVVSGTLARVSEESNDGNAVTAMHGPSAI